MNKLLVLIAIFVCSACTKRIESPSPYRHIVSPHTYQGKPQSPQSSPQSLKKKIAASSSICIALDPGHGGDAKGAKLIIPPYTYEKTLTLQTARKVNETLRQWGYKTFMTRTRDVNVPLLERVILSEQHNATIFVSIHYNSTPKPTHASGVEIFFCNKGNVMRAKESKELATAIIKRLQPVSKVPSRGVKQGNHVVLRESSIPAVLIECAFLSNPEDAKRLNKQSEINLLSWSIAKGIDDYLSSN